jgi:MerR family transcriptional regulator, light-induced transcriptional regulator
MTTHIDEKKVSALILASQDALSREIGKNRYGALQDMFDRFGVEPEKLQEYTQYELSYLANAIAEKNPGLYAEYIGWTKSMFSSYGIALDVLKINIDLVRAGLLAALPPGTNEIIYRYMQAGIAEISGPPEEPGSFIEPESPHGEIARRYLEAVLNGDRGNATRLVMDSFQAGTSIQEIYLDVLQPVQYEIGRLWQTNHITVAQEHFCSAVTQLVMSQLYYPHICNAEKKRGTMVGICVSGELHEIGMRMVADFFELAGWHVFYLGANMPSYNIVDTLLEKKADILGISAAMASSVNKVEKIIKKVRASDAACTKIIVGGFGFNRDPGLAKLVGADSFAASARDALLLAEGRGKSCVLSKNF